MIDKHTLARIRDTLAAMGRDLVCAYLFGSTARRTARPDSDLDLALLLAADPSPTLEGLQMPLADRLTETTGRSVDLVLLNRAPVDLVHRVLRDGVLLVDTDPSARIRFEVKARNEYFDLLPYLRQYRNPQKERAA
jgi:predicted nucleotidyltransferase